MPASTAGEGGGFHACHWQADAFHQVAGLTPALSSLLALTRPITSETWSVIRRDPAAVLLLLRQPADFPLRSDTLLSHLAAPALIERALLLLAQPTPALPFVSFASAPLAPLYEAMLCLAERASARAEATLGRVDPVQAWIAGLLASLGWLTVAAVAPQRVQTCWLDPDHRGQPQQTQQRHWGHDQDTLARHLARRWGLPGWVGAIPGRLRLTADMAVDLGTQRGLFEVVQQAAGEVARQGYPLGLVPLDPGEVPAVAKIPELRLDAETWGDPRQSDLLPELLRLALENRRLRSEADQVRMLEDENDRLHNALAARLTDERQRELTARLQALAELAAGAGHEINNPLAVISGRAQYLLSHGAEWFDPEANADVEQSLETIIAQTRRIHTLLRQLMLFARPPAPQRRPVDLLLLIGEVLRSQEELAIQRQVRLEGPVLTTEQAASRGWLLSLDSEQMRTVLTALVRNAIEAVPVAGWVRIDVRRSAVGKVDGWKNPVEVVVEDSGPGPAPEHEPYLFDPFFSGRPAGRGKGLGLPVAWQLVRQQGGELRYARPIGGPTRFVILLGPGLEEMRPECCSREPGGEAA